MAKERDVVAGAARSDIDHEHVVPIVVDRPGPANYKLAVDRRFADVGAVVADEQLCRIERIDADPVRIAKAPSLQPHDAPPQSGVDPTAEAAIRAGDAQRRILLGPGTATPYRVTAPADPVLVHGNRLGGAKGP